MTIGEVYRRLEDMDGRHSTDLAEIKTQVKATNGRVNKHDVSIGQLRWAIGVIGAVALTILGAVLAWVTG